MKRGNYLREPVSDFGAVLEKVLLHNQSTDDVTRLAVLQLDGDAYAAVTSLERRLLATPSQRDIVNGVVSIRRLDREELGRRNPRRQLRTCANQLYRTLSSMLRSERYGIEDQVVFSVNETLGTVHNRRAFTVAGRVIPAEAL